MYNTFGIACTRIHNHFEAHMLRDRTLRNKPSYDICHVIAADALIHVL